MNDICPFFYRDNHSEQSLYKRIPETDSMYELQHMHPHFQDSFPAYLHWLALGHDSGNQQLGYWMRLK